MTQAEIDPAEDPIQIETWKENTALTKGHTEMRTM